MTVYKQAGVARFTRPHTIETEGGLRLEAAKFILCISLVPFEAAVRPIIEGHTFGFCKLIVDRRSSHILGCHVVGERAMEIAQLAAVAADMRVDALARVAASFPTYAEVLVHAAVLAPSTSDCH